MKIVVAQDALHAEGGVESYLAAIIPALRNRGHSIALLFDRRGGGVPLVAAIDGPAVGVDAEHIDWSLPSCDRGVRTCVSRTTWRRLMSRRARWRNGRS